MSPRRPYTRQHYLPAVYLKQFSEDPPKGRKALLHCLKGDEPNKDTVESFCVEDFHYSSSNPAAAEQMFQKFEDMYANVLDEIKIRASAGTREFYGLIVMMMSLHLRNPSYFNRTKSERIDVYTDLEHQMFALLDLGADTLDESYELFKTRWGVKLLDAPFPLITSDNPSLIFSFHKEEGPQFILLPVTPGLLALAFDRRFAEYGGSMTKQDYEKVLRVLIKTSIEVLFAPIPFDGPDVEIVRKLRIHRQEPPGFVGDKEWRPNFLVVPEGCFSFVRKV